MGTVTGWRKASYSGNGGNNCVEVGQDWRKASHSSGNGGNCVEVGHDTRAVAVRDTKDRDGATLSVPAGAWASFTASLR
jgi:hypothetical protein